MSSRRTIGRHSFLLGLGASATLSACAVSDKLKPAKDKSAALASIDENRDFTVQGSAPLRDRAAAKNLMYGAAMGYPALSSNPAFADLRDVASLGLKILITEVDVIDQNLPTDIAIRDHFVAAAYEDYLSLVLEEPAVIAVLTWGLSDRYTWHSNWYPREDKAPVRPLPLDEQMKRKLAWNAIARAFDQALKREL